LNKTNINNNVIIINQQNTFWFFKIKN